MWWIAIGRFFKKAGTWLLEEPIRLMTVIAALLGAVLAVGHHKRTTRTLKDRVKIERAKQKVSALDAKRDALQRSADDNDREIEDLQSQRRDLQREVVALDQEVGDMGDEEVEQAFRDLF